MQLEIITKEDLQHFRMQLLNELKQIFQLKVTAQKEWIRSFEVQRLLKITSRKLQALTKNGTVRHARIGGLHLYKYDDVQNLPDHLNSNKTSNK